MNNEKLTFENGISIELVTVTPDMARDWLMKNKQNRKIKPKYVEQLKRDLEAGRWMLTGESIKFNKKDELVDGQHRLSAIIKANKAVQMFVFTGLSAECMKAIDTGKSRSSFDVATLNGCLNASTKTAAAKLVLTLVHYNGRLYNTRNITFSQQQILEEIEENPLYEQINFATRIAKNKILSKTEVLGLYVYLLRERKHPEQKIVDFFRQVADEKPACSAIRLLRMRISNRGTLDKNARAIYITKTWNKYIEGKGDEIKALSYNKENDCNLKLI